MRALVVTFAFVATISGLIAQTFPEIKLNDGRLLKEVEFLSYSQSAVVAKWAGGRGTIAYASLPEVVLKQIADRRPAKSGDRGKPSRQAPPKPAAPNPAAEQVGRVVIGDIGLTVVDSSDNYVTVSWKAELVNGKTEPYQSRVRVRFFNVDDFELDYDLGETPVIRGRQRGIVTGTSILKRSVWNAVTSYSIQLLD